ncbi:MFS transporter [Saccharibacillus sacchari]|uniref:Arabinose efflux permease family protein n=1 Tax=Saccharibacillus sacchari DSM 19268 TaxID=915437 RepID=A0A010YT34_9BACL|nr:MFS transporter [Saccharibacillus sacchari]EXG83325.1 arabinose efflux permease family protein [Saccharibacillus sacchari DSM 19268]
MFKARVSPRWSALLSLLFALACGLAVANIYYAQPLLGQLAQEFGVPPATIGYIIAVVQLFYAFGLILIVPLGDLMNRRRLILLQLLGIALALAFVGFAQDYAGLLAGLAAVGLMAVVTQVLVNFASALAPTTERGKAVGVVTGGVVIGILLARFFAGAISELADWRAVYLTSSGLTLLVALILVVMLPQDDSGKPGLSYNQLLRSMLKLFVQEKLLRIRAAFAFFIFTAFGMLWTPLSLPLSEAPLSLSPSLIGAFGLAGAAGAIGAARAGKWADRGMGNRATGIALVLLLVSWLPISMLHHSLLLLIAGILLLDFAVQVVHVTNQSLLFAALPEARGRLTGAYMVFYSIGSAAGAILSTWAYAAYGWSGVCWIGAMVSAGGCLLWVWTRVSKKALFGEEA